MGGPNSGRRPQPNALKILRGNPGCRAINLNEPRPLEGQVGKPHWLSEPACTVWDEIAPVCLHMRTLTTGDVVPFASMCELEATRRLASAQKNAEGFAPFIVSPDFDGADTAKVHPALKLERETANALRPYYEYFGMTPSARARIAIPPKDEKQSKWSAVK